MDNLLKGKYNLISAAVLAAYAGLFLWSAYAVFSGNQVDIYAENGLLESIQAILLIAACLVFLAPALLEQRADKLLLLSCSLLCYGFVLREVDAEKLAIPDFLVAIWSGTGRNVTLVLAFAAIGICAAKRFGHYKSMAISFLRARAGILLMAGGACLLLGEVFEKYVALRHHAFLEEVIELLGYVLILLSAIAVNALSAPWQPRQAGPDDL